MKKDELKNVILANGFGAFYKSTMLKADLQILALKSMGLAADKNFPSPRSTPARTPRSARKNVADSFEEAKAVPLPVPFEEELALQDTPRRRSTRQAAKTGVPESFPVPVAPMAASYDKEATDEEPSARPSMDSPAWEMVDRAFIVILAIVVVAMAIGYALSYPSVKDAVSSQWGNIKCMVLTRLNEAKGGL